MKRVRRSLIVWAVCAALMVTVAIVLSALSGRSVTASDWVALNIARPLVQFAGRVNSLVPFSVFEIFVVLAVVGAIVLIAVMIRALVKRRWHRALTGLFAVTVFVSGLIGYYTLTAGFVYNRSAVPVPTSQADYSSDDVVTIAEWFLDDYNALSAALDRDAEGNVICPYSMAELSDLIGQGYDALNGDGYFYDYTPRGKKIGSSWLMTLTNITGITFVPFGEPCINGQLPPSDLPATLAHEIAHAKGVMREGDCNFVAYRVLLGCDDAYLRYCGYFACFAYLLSAVDAGRTDRPNLSRLYAALDPAITAESRAAVDFWLEKSTQPGIVGALTRAFERMGSFFNDLYLKLNGVEEGTGSYSGPVIDGGIIDTGQINPDTGETVYEVVYSSVQKMFFALYEQRTAA